MEAVEAGHDILRDPEIAGEAREQRPWVAVNGFESRRPAAADDERADPRLLEDEVSVRMGYEMPDRRRRRFVTTIFNGAP